MMRRISVILTECLIALLLSMAGDRQCVAEITPGQTAPGFSLKDTGGKAYDLSSMTTQPMAILYFFDADSRPSQEGLLSLDKLTKRFKGQELVVWGITTSAPGIHRQVRISNQSGISGSPRSGQCQRSLCRPNDSADHLHPRAGPENPRLFPGRR